MRAFLCFLLIFLGGLGCAWIYPPITLLAPPATVHGAGLSDQVALQP
jgi:hypothetical protein